MAAPAFVACGDGDAEPAGPTVTQRVTRDFGRELLAAHEQAPLPKPPTIMRLVREHEEVETIFSGRIVDSIDGVRQTTEGSPQSRWVLNVNGIESDVLPPDYRLYPGDLVQWDLRRWESSLSVRSTVGAFPQTFTRGMFGERFPVTVVCERPSSGACRRVERTLAAAGVEPDGSAPAVLPPDRHVRRAELLVGTWDHWRDRRWLDGVEEGPRGSGIFARFSADGSSMRLFDRAAEPVRTVRSRAGLVGAIGPYDGLLIWLVTRGSRRRCSNPPGL
jgi:hypothetical protein